MISAPVPIEVADQISTVVCMKCNKTLVTGDHKTCMKAVREHLLRMDCETAMQHQLIMIPVVKQ